MADYRNEAIRQGDEAVDLQNEAVGSGNEAVHFLNEAVRLLDQPLRWVDRFPRQGAMRYQFSIELKHVCQSDGTDHFN